MDTIVALVLCALLFLLGMLGSPSEPHRGPQCTLVYPRGFEFSKATPEDGRSCGDIAVSWQACTPKWVI